MPGAAATIVAMPVALGKRMEGVTEKAEARARAQAEDSDPEPSSFSLAEAPR